ncbi:MAG: dockerin type I repeat-containing protein [Bacteroidales bacterium]|nr:dockerin type I repeat-containing protein [Bacteroidales bacterium]
MRFTFLAIVALISCFVAQASVTGLAVKSDATIIDRSGQGAGLFKFTYTPGGEQCDIVLRVVDAATGKPVQEDINNIPDEIALQPHGWAIARLTDWSTSKKDMAEVDKDGYRYFLGVDASHRYSVAVSSSTYGFLSVAYFYMPSADWKGTCNITVRFLAPGTVDVNGDGLSNVSDVTAVINMILGTAETDPLLADVNGDKEVNVSDVTAIINKILNQ